jgi:hypothetical protein
MIAAAAFLAGAHRSSFIAKDSTQPTIPLSLHSASFTHLHFT